MTLLSSSVQSRDAVLIAIESNQLLHITRLVIIDHFVRVWQRLIEVQKISEGGVEGQATRKSTPENGRLVEILVCLYQTCNRNTNTLSITRKISPSQPSIASRSGLRKAGWKTGWRAIFRVAAEATFFSFKAETTFFSVAAGWNFEN